MHLVVASLLGWLQREQSEAIAYLREENRILNVQKTRIVHVREGFAFLGYKIKRGQRALYLPAAKITSKVRRGSLYAYPTQKSIARFKDGVLSNNSVDLDIECL